MNILQLFIRKLLRRKQIDLESVTETKLDRCLTTFDLIGLGIGSTLGAGIYVVAGQVALQTAGPSVVISFLIAAIASVLAGLCYAEFGARFPKTGSAYVYSYLTVGELMAFVIGWNLILEYVIGTASVARAWSSYFDSLVDNKIQNFFRDHMPMNLTGLSSYPDFFAFGITQMLTGILAYGVKESARFTNIFTCVNLLVVLYVIICGMFKIDIHNWHLTKAEIPPQYSAGDGGFMPFGFSGMMSGAATCFYAFVGFDIIATTGEEVKNPQKAIPISIIVSLLTIFLAYFGISAVLTLMCPYYLLDPGAPLPAVFKRVGWDVAQYIIAIGAICGLSTSLLGAMFPLPRVIYAMATDGVIFRFLSQIQERFKTPLLATVLSGLFAGTMAMLFDLKELVDMMSIGTLLAYTLVAECVLLLRYKTNEDLPGSTRKIDVEITDVPIEPDIGSKSIFWPNYGEPTPYTQHVATMSVATGTCFITSFCATIIFAADELVNNVWYVVLLSAIQGVIILVCVYIIWAQPQNKAPLPFKVPGIPYTPAISVFINVYLMLKLSSATWIRFGVWMAIGFCIYFFYGIWHSSEPTEEDKIKLIDREKENRDESSFLLK